MWKPFDSLAAAPPHRPRHISPVTHFWPAWVAANAGGGAVSALLVALTFPMLLTVLSPIIFAVLGLVLGAAQSLVVRRYSVEAGLWIFATVSGGFAGSCVGIPLGMGLLAALGSESAWMLSALLVLVLIGLVAAGAQWKVVERRDPPPKLWLLLGAVATLSLAGCIALALTLPDLSVGFGPGSAGVASVAGGLVGGAAYAALVGPQVERLLKRATASS